jgi:hypothetical protein
MESVYVVNSFAEIFNLNEYKRTVYFKQENNELTETNFFILLRNSLTEGFPLDKYFFNKPVLNRGIVADHTGIEGNGI